MGEMLNTLLDENILERTGHVCADCSDPVTYVAEVFLLQVVKAQKLNGRRFLHAVIDEHDPGGDFLFELYYFCFSCWENLYEKVREETEDEPPITDEESQFECVCCGSGIREWEYVGAFTLGEFHRSHRSPSGVSGPVFVPNGDTDLICLYCLVIINEGHLAMWDELSQTGECQDCTQARCWRIQDCTCLCHRDVADLLEEDDEHQP